jgi:Tfp pilus assembly protein PilF
VAVWFRAAAELIPIQPLVGPRQQQEIRATRVRGWDFLQREQAVDAKEVLAKALKAAMQFWAAVVVVALAQQTTQADQTQAEKAATASPSSQLTSDP